ncbi:MAG: hypothetical protein ABIP68_01320, partial [Ferruginibacter sp.]
TYENEVLVRELNILKEIAKKHDLMDLFEELLMTTKRKVIRTEEIYGFLITRSIRFEGTKLGIYNIFDASLATNFVYNFYNKVSFNEVVVFIKNSWRVLLRSKKYKPENLPNIN